MSDPATNNQLVAFHQRYEDVRTLTAGRLSADGIAVDVITGGFPCQDISVAGKQAGIAEGTRSGLWSEIVRLACELRPQFIVVENVANLLAGPSERPGGWFGRVLGDLAECGYDAEWENIPAAAVGAPHRRERIWIVAYDNKATESAQTHERREPISFQRTEVRPFSCSGGTIVAYASKVGQPRQGQSIFAGCFQKDCEGQAVDAVSSGVGSIWGVEPDVGRVAYGVPARMDRLSALGNAVVPQIPELIGRAILQARAAA